MPGAPRLTKLRTAARLRATRLTRWPPVGSIRFGSLRRLTPVSDVFGFDRGLPIDRYYIERFLAAHAGSIRGSVLEFGDTTYTTRFAREGAVASVDVLDASADNPRATLVADLTRPETIEANRFDCVVCTQTLPFIYDVHSAVETLHRILRPGGTVLATVPCVSRIWTKGDRIYGDYWRFTSRSSRMLFEEAFSPGGVTVVAYGNVLSAACFLYGLAASELTAGELDAFDPAFETLIAVAAVKEATSAPS